jgi:hypothetical protein
MNPLKQTACQHFFNCFLTLFTGESLEMKTNAHENGHQIGKNWFFSTVSGHPLPTSHQNGSTSPTSGHNAWHWASLETARFNRGKKFADTVTEAVIDAIESDWKSLFARY